MALVYSCCFWFSLRLGGIIIGLFSLVQGALVLTVCCIGYAYSDEIEAELSEWNNNYNLIYFKDYVENIMQDSKKHLSLFIGISCVYITSCVLYIYGAYICSNIMMYTYIILEFLRLVLISMIMATGLLFIKQNTMDIGFLIGASVVGGFFLLGMFYLWVCTANLPVLINEMERDEQAATIVKLQKLLESNQGPTRRDRYGNSDEPDFGKGIFVVRKHGGLDGGIITGSRIPIPY